MKEKDKDLNFEKALTDLEAVVAKLEEGGTSLNESLALFERGVKLARFLRDELDRAEKKIEILLKDEKGGLKAEPFGLEEAEGGSAAEGSKAGAESGGNEAGETSRKSRARPKKTEDDSSLPF